MKSGVDKYAEQPIAYGAGTLPDDFSEDKALGLMEGGKHYAVTNVFEEPIDNDVDEDLVIQYEVQAQGGQACGGSYIKLLHATDDLDAAKVFIAHPHAQLSGYGA